MDIDETELIQFFGVLPVEEDAEEKEFFGSSTFRVREGTKTWTVHFGAHHGDVGVVLEMEGHGAPVLRATLTDITAVRVDEDAEILRIMGQARGATGTDPEVTERATITLAPLTVVTRD